MGAWHARMIGSRRLAGRKKKRPKTAAPDYTTEQLRAHPVMVPHLAGDEGGHERPSSGDAHVDQYRGEDQGMTPSTHPMPAPALQTGDGPVQSPLRPVPRQLTGWQGSLVLGL